MKKNRLIFRADGSTTKGYGHVIRMLSLANMLKKKYSCHFVIQKPDAFLKAQIHSVCDSIIELSNSKNLTKEANFIASNFLNPTDIFILDGYSFDTTYQSIIKKNTFKLVCIDDIYDKHFVADAVINHSEGINERLYSKEKYTKLYLGSKYAILRKSFLNNSKSQKTNGKIQRVFINMGGSDEHNFSSKALSICLKNTQIKKIDIVVGSFYNFKNELNKIIVKNKNTDIKIHSNISEKEICNLMKKSDVGICSASTVSYEYACVGGLMFIYKTASNQKNIHSFLLKSKIAFPVSDFDKQLKAFQNKKTLAHYYKNRLSYFDGHSKNNILSIFESFEQERNLTFRRATIKDSITYYNWVNEKEVRNNSVNQADIDIESHIKWFNNRLNSPKSALYIFEFDGQALGQVRFDEENNKAEIDYSIDAKFRGKGWGEIILSKAIADYTKTYTQNKIIAKVKASNIPSNKIFTKIGFKMLKPTTINKIIYNKYTF